MTSTEPIYFITGNKDKVLEISELIPGIEQLDIDLPEIQSLDMHDIIKAKLKVALDHHSGPFIVEDTSIEINGLGGLPGPFIKWFGRAIGNEGIFRMASASDDTSAVGRTLIGFARSRKEVHFFEGTMLGKIVSPRGERGFGWDAIFMPEGSDKTFAEMDDPDRIGRKARRDAIIQLAENLSNISN